MSQSFDLGKRKNDNNDIKSYPPLKKQNISYSLYNNNYSIPPPVIGVNDNTNIPPLQTYIDNNSTINSYTLTKHKINEKTNNRNYSFPSIICVDDFGIFCKKFYKLFNNYFTLCISNDKTIYSVGYSDYKSHGHDTNEIFPIKQIKHLSNIKMISCGAFHTICLTYNGDVYSFGCNGKGQLGISKDENELENSTKITLLPPCKEISCGEEYTMCLTEDNKLYSFGYNFYGQLGLGNNNKIYNSPQLIPDFNNIEFIECGANHSICKTYNNEFYSWGSNYYGKLGQSTNSDCNKPIQCLNWPDNIIDIKSAYNHTLLLTSEGQIYSFGSNEYGQLGINDKNIKSINIPTLIKDIPEIQRIECGYYHSMCIDINNNLWIFGHNLYGQLGLGDEEYRYKPILHPILSNIIDISSGGHHSFVKTIDNKIYAFGKNDYGQLGIKTSEEKQLTPIQVFKDNSEIWCSFIGKSKQKSARK